MLVFKIGQTKVDRGYLNTYTTFVLPCCGTCVVVLQVLNTNSS